MHSTRNQLLRLLAPGEFMSGTVLGTQLSVSRTAVAKHIDGLKHLGLDIYSVKGKGYKLSAPLSLLSAISISQYYQQLYKASSGSQNEPLNLHVLNIIDSTNTYIKTHLQSLDSGTACIAEAQTAGRGRHGRQWVSPFGSSIYLSMYWCFAGGYQTLSGLSLVVGLAVHATLAQCGVDTAKLKWPNDVYVNMQKIAGILIEVEGSVGDSVHCVIGVGLNVNLPDGIGGIEQPFTDLQSQLDEQMVDRNHLTAQLIHQLRQYMLQFEAHGLAPFIAQWQALNVFDQQEINVHFGQDIISGTCIGINEQGALLVDVAGQVKSFHGGEISVRAK